MPDSPASRGAGRTRRRGELDGEAARQVDGRWASGVPGNSRDHGTGNRSPPPRRAARGSPLQAAFRSHPGPGSLFWLSSAALAWTTERRTSASRLSRRPVVAPLPRRLLRRGVRSRALAERPSRPPAWPRHPPPRPSRGACPRRDGAFPGSPATPVTPPPPCRRRATSPAAPPPRRPRLPSRQRSSVPVASRAAAPGRSGRRLGRASRAGGLRLTDDLLLRLLARPGLQRGIGRRRGGWHRRRCPPAGPPPRWRRPPAATRRCGACFFATGERPAAATDVRRRACRSIFALGRGGRLRRAVAVRWRGRAHRSAGVVGSSTRATSEASPGAGCGGGARRPASAAVARVTSPASARSAAAARARAAASSP